MTQKRVSEKDVFALARPDLVAMPGYEPVEPVDILAARLGIPENEIIKLDGNENPYGPSPRVAQALARFRYYHIYTDPAQRRLRGAIGDFEGVDPERIVAGAGSDELLDLVARLFLFEGDTVVTAPPTFGMYEFEARLHGAKLVGVPRQEDFGLDVPALEETLRRGAKLIYLASPNNPTGNPMTRDELKRLLAFPSIVVVDEAYAEFAGTSFIDLVPDYQNLIVARTFSKWAGLAGLRIGYAVFPDKLASVIHKIKMPYNLNAAAEVAALESLEDAELLMERVKAIIEERERFSELLTTIPWLKPYPSQANFILCEVRKGSATRVRDRLRERGIFIRHFDVPGVQNCVRISVGRPDQMDRVMAVLREIGDGNDR